MCTKCRGTDSIEYEYILMYIFIYILSSPFLRKVPRSLMTAHYDYAVRLVQLVQHHAYESKLHPRAAFLIRPS